MLSSILTLTLAAGILVVSHQSQILETFQQGGVTIVCVFDERDITEGAFMGVEGVGKYGYP
ncbi:MAG: hypothetical protein IKM28_09215 [Lachnospiraceae bacterium]|nr:hypothetical protein [Lachnospiraceae bacterium]